MSETDFLLALENVTVSFDGFKAVNALNLYIDKGEMRVIIGPNGAGKTTVLDLICGRTPIAEGSIKFKNQGENATVIADLVKTKNGWRIDDLRVPVAGRWQVRVEILVSDFEKIVVEEDTDLPRLP